MDNNNLTPVEPIETTDDFTVFNDDEDYTEESSGELSTTDNELLEIDCNENKEESLANDTEIDEESIKDAFDPYNLSNEDGVVMLKLIEQYKETKSPKGIYNQLPQSMKNIVNDMIVGVEVNKAQNIGFLRNNAVGLLFDQMLQDAKINQAYNDYINEMQNALSEMNTTYDGLFRDAFNETFDQIESIKVEEPEKAETILKVKNAFESAYDFSYYLDWVDNISPNKFNKWLSRFDTDADYLNNRINSTFLNNVPSIKDLFIPIKANMPVGEYADEDITKFLCMIYHRSIKDDIENDIGDLAYYYRLITDIYSYTFTISSALDERGTKIFNGIKEVLDKIKSL